MQNVGETGAISGMCDAVDVEIGVTSLLLTVLLNVHLLDAQNKLSRYSKECLRTA